MNKEEFVRDYQTLKLTEMTTKYGVSKQHIYNLLRRFGIEFKGRASNGRTAERRKLEKKKCEM